MKKNLKIIFLILVLVVVNLFTCMSSEPVSINNSEIFPETGTQDTEETAEVIAPTRAEIVMKALMRSYPDLIEKVEFLNDDWALFLRGTWYYYAGGRLLPESEIENTANYRSMQFYNYPAELPEWVARTTEEARRYSSWSTGSNTRTQSQVQVRRSNFFLDSIWQASTRVETERRLSSFNFLGKQIKVHQAIHEKLTVIERQIRAAAAAEPEVQVWITGIGNLESYGWRNIAITDSRSYHSYGLAVDILPRSLGGKQTYWLWSSQAGRDWWNVSYSERYHPPSSVIKIFESYGFIWGGKWQQFDTMHFEYRPEILILAGFDVTGLTD